jgi:ppGpp synthetase/RelA/SpoT-type nucleotidyltranferase
MKTVDKSSWKQMEHDLSDRAAGIEPQHQLSRPKKKVAEIINLEDRMRQSAREKLKTPRATRYGDPLDIDRPVCRKTLAQWPLQMRATLG